MVRSVVVTGGSRGLGLGIVQTLAQAGFHVIVIARTLSSALEALMAQHPSTIGFISWDLSKIATFAELSRSLRNQFGPLYGLVNNAGIGTAGILSMTPDPEIDRVMRMNVISPITLTKYLIRPMMTAQAGRVVNISSIVATTGYPGLAAYSASKAALIGFTRSLAREVGSMGITVNAVAPGFVETEMTHGLNEKQREQIKRRSALHRMAAPDDVSEAVAFLLSDRARNITGTVMTVDAGNTA